MCCSSMRGFALCYPLVVPIYRRMKEMHTAHKTCSRSRQPNRPYYNQRCSFISMCAVCGRHASYGVCRAWHVVAHLTVASSITCISGHHTGLIRCATELSLMRFPRLRCTSGALSGPSLYYGQQRLASRINATHLTRHTAILTVT